MKKKFTYLFSVVMAFAFLGTVQAKEITIYVQADQQPNLHFWGIPNETSEWPGVKLTETTTVNNLEGTPVTFYYKTFTNLEEESGISFLFNYNGDSDKTRDINGVMEDRYYIYKGNHEYEDITSLMTGKADDVIEKVQLPGDFSGWNGDANTFELGEGRYNYVRVVDFSEVTADFVTFKLLVNNGHWLGWNDLIINAPDGWTQEAAADGNIQLNLKAIGAKQFIFIATWAGGHVASAGWKLSINSKIILSETDLNTLPNENMTNMDVKLYRTLVAGSWNSICLPFDLDATGISSVFGAGTKVAAFTSATGTNLHFDLVPTMSAKTPYLIDPANNRDMNTPIELSGITIQVGPQTVSHSPFNFTGIYTPTAIDGKYFIASGNTIKKSNGGTLKGFRAYIEDTTPNNAARILTLDFSDGETTEITTTDFIEFTEKGVRNTLDGRKLDKKPTSKGLYIVNGKKVVVK